MAFSHGDAVVRGVFRGRVTKHERIIAIEGTIEYTFQDVFTDPLDLREGTAYARRGLLQVYRVLRQLVVRLGVEEGPLLDLEEVDPDDVRRLFLIISEVGGTAYAVTGTWRSTFYAEVLRDGNSSLYRKRAQ